MSADFDLDDFARLLALEHALYALTLITACNFAYLKDTTPSAAVAEFRQAIEGSLFDGPTHPAEITEHMRAHLKRMFDHVAKMAEHADLGVS